MSEHHAFASLTPKLLARKGGAKPAMRRQDTARFVQAASTEDLGWNDWGNATSPGSMSLPPAAQPQTVSAPLPVPEETPGSTAAVPEPIDRKADAETAASPQVLAESVMPEVLRQIEDLAWRINQAVIPASGPPSLASGKRAAFTLRLDPERHFRLKMAAVVLDRSAQTLVTDALDKYLSEIPEVASLKSTARDPR